MELIVALDLSQHVKHLSEISDVLECNCNSIFTLVPLAVQIPPVVLWPVWHSGTARSPPCCLM